MKQVGKEMPQIKDHNCEPPLLSQASNEYKFYYLASSMDPSPKILVRMGVEKRVKTTRRPKKPPASSMLLLESILMMIGQMMMINSLNP